MSCKEALKSRLDLVAQTAVVEEGNTLVFCSANSCHTVACQTVQLPKTHSTQTFLHFYKQCNTMAMVMLIASLLVNLPSD
jgi:hypothetical protein